MNPIFVPGTPLPAGSGDRLPIRCRCGKLWNAGPYLDNSNRSTTKRKSGGLKRWQAAIAGEAAVAMWEAGEGKTGEAVSVELVFWMPAPKKHSRWPDKKPDIDKLTRAALDGLTGTAWEDDGQVVRVNAEKRYADLEHPLTGVSIAWEVIG